MACRITGFPATSIAMGSQTPQTFLSLLQEAENADHGLIAEPRTALALGYRTSASMCAQDLTPNGPLVLDYGQGQLGSAGQPMTPSDDDQLTVNDETVTRGSGNTTGSSFGAQLTAAAEAAATGALNITPPPPGGTGVGDYADAQTVNVQLDGQLGDQAWWLVHQGTVDEVRYTTIPLDLASTDPGLSALFYEILGLDVGDLAEILNPPPYVGPDTIRQLAWGLAEQFGVKLAKLQWNTRPASVWDVLIAGTGAPTDCRADTDGSTLTAGYTATAASLSVTTMAGVPVWTTDPDDCPFDIVVTGERMTVTSITGTTSPQVFTVIRSVNGVSKAHLAGEPVSLFQPCYFALA